jgi:hypothetical protein
VEAGRAISLALELHNETGHGPKLINVLKATLYTLMPPGSVLIIPDSLWISPILASWLVGNCLRGGRVLIVAPALANAPSNRFPQMSRAQELFTRLIVLQREFDSEIHAAGGMLKTGVYALDVGAGDIAGRLRVIDESFATEPFLRDVVGLQSSVAWSARSERMLGEPDGEPDADASMKEKPKLHAKTHFLASAEAWRVITERPDLGPLVDVFIRQIMEETRPETLEKFVAYLMVGSYNQNYRSMLMDGEVMLTVEGGTVIHGLIDYLSLLGSTTWVDDLEELEEHLPAHGGLKFRFARSFKEMF